MSGHLGVLGLWYRWGRGIRLASSDAISVDFGGMSAVSPTDLERREEIEPGPSLCCQSGLTQSIDNAQGRFLCPCSHFWEVSRPGVLCPLRMPPTAVFQKKKKVFFWAAVFSFMGNLLEYKEIFWLSPPVLSFPLILGKPSFSFLLMKLPLPFRSFIEGFEDSFNHEPDLEQLKIYFLYSGGGGSFWIFTDHHSNVARKFKKSKKLFTYVKLDHSYLITRAIIRITSLREPEGHQIDLYIRWQLYGTMSLVYKWKQTNLRKSITSREKRKLMFLGREA